MDDMMRLSKLDRELGEVIARLNHLPNNDTITAVRKEQSEQAFRTLQEVGGLIGNMRSDVKDWIGGLREKNALELAAAEQRLSAMNEASEHRLMVAINAQNSRPWIMKNLPLMIAVFGVFLAIVSGNPQWLKFGSF
jgi:hypothetical protein